MTEQQTDLDAADIHAIMSELRAGASLQQGEGPQLQDIADQHRDVIAQLRKLSPVHAATAFGSLLTVPELQANCLRLETLVRLSLMVANGKAKPTQAFVRAAFASLGEGFCGRMEDPAEDVFVGTVRTPRGNFRVIEGMWEGSAFYLQRFLNVVDAMPVGSGYDDLRDSIHALLTLSDLVCERARLERYQVGEEGPLDRLNAKLLGTIGGKGRRIRLSLDELRRAGLDRYSLAPFLFTPADRSTLSAERLGASSLEQRPLIRERDHVVLVMPTAISAAIRYHVIERMSDAGMLAALRRGIANEYAQHFAHTQLLGGRLGAPIAFEFTKHGAIAGVVSMVDEGRYLNLIFYTDHLSDFEETGVGGMNPDCDGIAEVVRKHVEQAHKVVSARPGFVDGISLVVGCGIGRGSAIFLDQEDLPNWRVEFASAYDVDTLSWSRGFKPLSLWRLMDAGEHVGELGTALHNINGLLNLVAWQRSLNGHLVPHGDLPENFTGGMLMISQNSQRQLRHEVMTTYDPKVVQDVNGQWIPVRRDQQSDFADDQVAPLYGSEIPNEEGWLMSVYLAPNRAWWAEASMPETTPGALGYDRWRIVTVWLARVAPRLDALGTMPEGPVKWRAVFESTTGGLREQTPQLSYEQARAAISVSVDHRARTVTTTASADFEDAIHHPENIAERALVDAMLEGFMSLAEAPQDDRSDVLDSIVPDRFARQAHALAAQSFRDFVHHALPRQVVKIDKNDDAAMRLELGWKVRDRSLGSRLTGKAETTAYLNKLVRSVEDGLSADLRAFNREKLLSRLLLNHESAAVDRDRWNRTAAAVLALHPDRQATLATIAEHDFELNGVFQASRILMEVAVCESPLDGGRTPGDLDLSRLMAKALLLFYMGGWSDAIRWDVMEAFVQITPLGDVHAKFDYFDSIIAPHARETSDVRVNEAANSYADKLKQPEPRASIASVVDQRFQEAWEEEFGASLQDMRVLVDWLENRGIERGEALMRMARTDFVDVNAEGQVLEDDVVATLLDRLTLASRPSWRVVPEGFDDRDPQPWRFRRRLSPMRRPIVQIGKAGAECLLVAPGMVRDVFTYMVANYMRGDFPPYQLKGKMRAWAAREANARGARFTQDVAAVLRKLGWEVQTEVKVTKILGRRLDRDYGDVDVLAWDSATNRILVIECKDVQFKKTIGEISEQLADFRGELRSNGKPDYLRRHLDRMAVLRENARELASYLEFATCEPEAESHLVFKNPVPMRYALAKLSERVKVSTIDEVVGWAGPPCGVAGLTV